MPPSRARLTMAAPAPHKDRPFRFLDLPAEIRNVVYKLLMDSCKMVRIPDVELSGHVTDTITAVYNCYWPAMMSVNKQVKDEYTTLAMPRIYLYANWRIVEDRSLLRGDNSTSQILPKSLFSQLMVLNLIVWICEPFLSSSITSVAHLVRAVTRGMPQLSVFLFTAAYNIDMACSQGVPLEMSQYRAWKQQMTTSLATIVESMAFLTVDAKFAICCNLYCPHDDVADEHVPGSIPPAVFALCNGPDTDAFELDGVDVKFLGVGNVLIGGDSNTHVILIGSEMLDGRDF